MEHSVFVSSTEQLSPEEISLLDSLLPENASTTIDPQRNHVPQFTFAGGPGETVPLAWIVFSFIGTGAAIMLKSFLESIGSELGKKFVELFKRRKASSGEPPLHGTPAHSIAVLVEIRQGVVAVIPIPSPTDAAFITLQDIPRELENAVRSLKSGEPAKIILFHTRDKWSWVIDGIESHAPLVWDLKRGVIQFYE